MSKNSPYSAFYIKLFARNIRDIAIVIVCLAKDKLRLASDKDWERAQVLAEAIEHRFEVMEKLLPKANAEKDDTVQYFKNRLKRK